MKKTPPGRSGKLPRIWLNLLIELSGVVLLFLNQFPRLRPPIIMAIEQDVLQRNDRFYSYDTFNSSYCIAVDRGWTSLPGNVPSAQVRPLPAIRGHLLQRISHTLQSWMLYFTMVDDARFKSNCCYVVTYLFVHVFSDHFCDFHIICVW